MADLYTSFATSVALRDAGAPQGDYAAPRRTGNETDTESHKG